MVVNKIVSSDEDEPQPRKRLRRERAAPTDDYPLEDEALRKVAPRSVVTKRLYHRSFINLIHREPSTPTPMLTLNGLTNLADTPKPTFDEALASTKNNVHNLVNDIKMMMDALSREEDSLMADKAEVLQAIICLEEKKGGIDSKLANLPARKQHAAEGSG